MSKPPIQEKLPPQRSGNKTDTHHKVSYETVEEAKEMFEVVKQRMLDVNHWYDLTGKGTASFQLTNEDGADLNRPAQVGDKIKINIPAPGLTSGKGYDWVRIEKIEQDKGDPDAKEADFIMQVRPSETAGDGSKEVAHFFKNTATSSFVVQRKDNVLVTEVHGRNEIPNTDSKGWIDKIRNFFIGAFAGAGFSHPQWKALVVALQKKKK